MTVGLLAGTFDPPHVGHLQMARACLWSGKIDKVVFLPCWKHAFGKEPTDFDHRATMCELMVKDHGDDRIEVWRDEAEIESTYSIEILEFINTKHPEVDKFRLILGADNYWKMNKWKQPSKVWALAESLWVDRPGESRIPEESLVCNLDISSSDIRHKIRSLKLSSGRMEDVFKGELSLRVIKYIREYGLYKKED